MDSLVISCMLSVLEYLDQLTLLVAEVTQLLFWYLDYWWMLLQVPSGLVTSYNHLPRPGHQPGKYVPGYLELRNFKDLFPWA